MEENVVLVVLGIVFLHILALGSLINNVGRVIHKSSRGVLHNVTRETRAFFFSFSFRKSKSFHTVTEGHRDRVDR